VRRPGQPVALLATQLDLREKLHSARVGEAVSAFNAATTDRLAALTQQFVARGVESLAAGHQALGVLAGTVRREAFVMAHSDCFFLLGVVLLSTVLLVWLCRPAKGAAVGH
jgi:MFS transporter, DHA2 family, multidrug resistance protein